MEQNKGFATATPITYSAEMEVKCYLEEFARAIRRGQLKQIMSFYANDVLAFDMMPPLEISGTAEYGRVWERCLTGYFKFPVEFEFTDLSITVSGELALVHGIIHMQGNSLRDGREFESYIRNTTCLTRIDGEWRITHEHNSVPIDARTGQPLMNVRPRHFHS